MLAAWHVDSGSLTQLGKELTEQVTPLKHGNLAYAAEWKEYAMDRSMAVRPRTSIWSTSRTDNARRSRTTCPRIGIFRRVPAESIFCISKTITIG